MNRGAKYSDAMATISNRQYIAGAPMYTHRERQTEWYTERHLDIHWDRHTQPPPIDHIADRQTDRQKDRQTVTHRQTQEDTHTTTSNQQHIAGVTMYTKIKINHYKYTNSKTFRNTIWYKVSSIPSRFTKWKLLRECRPQNYLTMGQFNQLW